MLHVGRACFAQRWPVVKQPKLSCSLYSIFGRLSPYSNRFSHVRSVVSPPSHATGAVTVAARLVDKFPNFIQPYLRLSRFDKPAGALLALWPGLWSVGMAASHLPSTDASILLYTSVAFTAGSFLVRSAGCIINDMWDRDFDRRVERTRHRPLASGEINFFPALVYLGANLSAALLVLLEFNWYT